MSAGLGALIHVSTLAAPAASASKKDSLENLEDQLYECLEERMKLIQGSLTREISVWALGALGSAIALTYLSTYLDQLLDREFEALDCFKRGQSYKPSSQFPFPKSSLEPDECQDNFAVKPLLSLAMKCAGFGGFMPTIHLLSWKPFSPWFSPWNAVTRWRSDPALNERIFRILAEVPKTKEYQAIQEQRAVQTRNFLPLGVMDSLQRRRLVLFNNSLEVPAHIHLLSPDFCSQMDEFATTALSVDKKVLEQLRDIRRCREYNLKSIKLLSFFDLHPQIQKIILEYWNPISPKALFELRDTRFC